MIDSIDYGLRCSVGYISEMTYKPSERDQPDLVTALHGMQTRSSDENSVCLSVRLSVHLTTACIVTKRKKNLSRFLYSVKDHLT